MLCKRFKLYSKEPNFRLIIFLSLKLQNEYVNAYQKPHALFLEIEAFITPNKCYISLHITFVLLHKGYIEACHKRKR